ncbi:hypothetical protein [Ruminococcus sp.]|uniref:hypothetical protein n=1 Tax=Ruminococcus sp. TaxID=41978 RepID=UPI0025F8B4A8|nr:hypothetical protein [Ruminococcus sp.]
MKLQKSAKYSPFRILLKFAERLGTISIPAQLDKNASRYQVGGVLSKNTRANDILTLIAEMADSKTVLMSYLANDPNVGLSSNKDLSKFKMFVCDTGLFATLMFKDNDFTENDIYQKLLSDKLSANLGYLFGNQGHGF